MRIPIAITTTFQGLLLLTGAVTASAADNGQKYELRYRFEAGQSVPYEVDNQARISLQKGPSQQQITNNSIADKRYTVRSVDGDGNAVLVLQIDRVRMTAAVDGAKTVTFDSKSEEKPPAAIQQLAGTIGKPISRVEVSPAGELLSIEWLVGDADAQKPTAEDEANFDVLVPLPNEPLSIGETWKQPLSAEVTAGAKLKKTIKLQREYTLKQVEGDRATIQLKTSVLTPIHDPAQECQIIGKLLGGTIVFDMGRGLVVSRELSVDRMVVGFEGPNSKIHHVNTRVEKLAQTQIAADANPDAVRK